MKYCKTALLAICLFLIVTLPGVTLAASAHGSREEAQAMCEKAAALIKSDGFDKATAKFQDKNGGFIDRDLYVFALDNNGTFVAHGAKPILVGKGGMDMKDVDGFAFIKAFVDIKDSG